MGKLIEPVKVVTKDGEITVHISLDLNLNGLATEQKKIEEEKTDWAIPTFAPTEKIKFGKKE